MSVCVVALRSRVYVILRTHESRLFCLPERVSDNEQGDVFLVCIAQDLVALRLDHVAVSEDQFFPVECFLRGQRLDCILSN